MIKNDSGVVSVPLKSLGVKVIDGDRGKNYPKQEDFLTKGHCLFLSAKNVTKSGFRFEEKSYITKEKDEALSKGKLVRGDIVITTRGTVGNFAYFNSSVGNDHIRINSGMAIIRNTGTQAESEFLFQLMRSPVISKQIDFLAFGSAQPQLTIPMIATIRVPMFPVSEQRKIAAILSTWDRAIELTEKLIAAKQKRKQALMQQLLTGKVRCKEFAGKHWIRVPLGKLLKDVKRFVKWNDAAEYHLLSIRRRSGGMFDRETKIGHDIKTKIMMTTETGDFVIARMPAVHGAIAVTPPIYDGKHVSGSYSTLVAKDLNTLHMPFLNYVSQTLAFYRLLLLSAYGVTIEKMTFNLPWFLDEKISLPPTLNEQKQIAEVFVAIENENDLLMIRLDKLIQQKKGLMQQLLTGKIRVNVDELRSKFVNLEITP